MKGFIKNFKKFLRVKNKVLSSLKVKSYFAPKNESFNLTNNIKFLKLGQDIYAPVPQPNCKAKQYFKVNNLAFISINNENKNNNVEFIISINYNKNGIKKFYSYDACSNEIKQQLSKFVSGCVNITYRNKEDLNQSNKKVIIKSTEQSFKTQPQKKANVTTSYIHTPANKNITANIGSTQIKGIIIPKQTASATNSERYFPKSYTNSQTTSSKSNIKKLEYNKNSHLSQSDIRRTINIDDSIFTGAYGNTKNNKIKSGISKKDIKPFTIDTSNKYAKKRNLSAYQNKTFAELDALEKTGKLSREEVNNILFFE